MSYTPRRWSSYKSLTEKDNIAPMKEERSPSTLYEICVENILKTTALAERAAVTLPYDQIHYILYLALKRLVNGEPKSYMMIHKIISKWAHTKLLFSFQTDPLLQKYQKSAFSWRTCCLPPHVYYGINGIIKSKFDLCARDIAIGLFNYVYHLDLKDSENTSTLEIVDLSDIQLATESHPIWGTDRTAEPFYILSQGEFPGRAAYECLSPEDFLFIGTKKPKLQNQTGRQPIKLFVNFKITAKNQLERFNQSLKTHSRYKLQLKSLDISALSMQGIDPILNDMDISNLENLFVSNTQSFSSSFLKQPSFIWVLQEKSSNTNLLKSILSSSENLKTLFLSVSNFSCTSAMDAISESPGKCLPEAFSLFGGGGSASNYSPFGKCLSKLGSNLTYLHLLNWIPTCIPLDSLASCENLRVLSIVGKETMQSEQPVGSVFKTILSFKKLEYLEIYQNTTLKASDLVELRKVLKSLYSLAHCHMHFSGMLLKRADLDIQSNGPVHQLIRIILGSGTRGNSMLYRQPENFQFRMIKGWLHDLRPDVCFELDSKDSSICNDLIHLKGRRYFF